MADWTLRFGERISRWWYRPPSSEKLWPIVLHRKRVYILPTHEGLFFSFVLIAMLFGAINYEISLGHALVFLLAGLSIAALFQTFRNIAGLEITPGQALPVFAGSCARFPLHLFNQRLQPRSALEFVIDDESVCCNLPGKGNQTILVPQKAKRRGRMRMDRVTLSTRYPLGLFRAWAYPYPMVEVLVYPTPLSMPLPPLTSIENPGSRIGGSGQEDFAGLRNHRPSDPPRHIAWKAAARASDEAPLLVKQFSGGAASELWLDFSAIQNQDEEHRLSILTGWVLAAETQSVDYGLRLPGSIFEPSRGEEHQRRCLEALALHGLTAQ